MAKAARPRRSVLYMPGANVRALEKGRELAADALIFDLEDSVAPEAKEAARANVVAALQAGGYGKREIAVRVNALETPWGADDLTAVARAGAAAVLLPKVEKASQVQEAERRLVAAGAPHDLALWAMMETPLGILHAEEIAFSSQRLAVLVMGTSDLVKDLQATHRPAREPVVTALSLCLLAARAAHLAIVDGVHLDLNDDAGFAAVCQQGKDFGFDGKTLIHPKTLAVANEIFAPSARDVEQAQRIIAAHAAAAAQGRGLVVLDGKLIENLHVIAAQRVVALAQVIAQG